MPLVACPTPVPPLGLLLWFGGFIALSIAVLAGPPLVAVRKLTSARAVAPLLRGSFELWTVYVLSGCSAVALVAQLCALTLALVGREGLRDVACALALAAPLFAVTPWAAGEVMSGPSRRPVAAAAAAVSIGVACGWAIVFASFWLEGGAGGPLVFLLSGVACSAVSSAAYLAVRGLPAASDRSDLGVVPASNVTVEVLR